MSNISYNFLTESFLFHEADSKYSKRSLDEIEKELSKYKEYINTNIVELNNEISTENNFIQPLSQRHPLPSVEELLQGCIFLDRYIIDDPIYRFNIEQIKMENIERFQMGMKTLDDDIIKSKLADKILYMKNLTPGVNVELGYIKFYPLGLLLDNYYKSGIRIPDFNTNSISEGVYKWFQNQLSITNLKKDSVRGSLVLDENLQISNFIALRFKDDNPKNVFISHYQQLQPIACNGQNYTVKFNGDVIPTKFEYENWIYGEKIKYIKDMLKFYSYRDYLCNLFNSPVCLETELEKNFYSKNFDSQDISNFHTLGFDLNIPGLQKLSFEKAMEIRKHCHLSFQSLQKKIKEDSKQLRTANDPKIYDSIVKEIENEYLDEIKSTNVLLESLKGIFAFDNLISYGLCGYSYFTGADPKITTGLTVLSGIYNVGKITKESISNPMYFLKKISTN